MSRLPWMPVYIGDELAETSHLTAEEYGAYATLKMHYWQHGRLPADDERLARIARCNPERWDSVKQSIWNLFEDDWRLPRLEALRAEAEETHRRRSEAGKKGGRPRNDEKPGYKPGFSEEKAGPKQSKPQPHTPAYDGEVSTHAHVHAHARETMFTPYQVPGSPAEARAFLEAKGVPADRLDECARQMLGGHLTPYDVEGVIERSAA